MVVMAFSAGSILAQEFAWTQTSAPATNWVAIALSSDGLKLTAVVYGGGIYTSTNSGITWVMTSAPARNWSGVAASSDGTKLAAAGSGAGIYISTNSGVTWTQTTNFATGYLTIASSSDGTKLVAANSGGGIHTGIYTSTNLGLTWTKGSITNSGWQSVASSSDGLKLAAVAYAGGIYTSTNSGLTWLITTAPTNTWTSIASSSDGTVLVAGCNGNGGVFTSTNSGLTWTKTELATGEWLGVASSSDGTRLAAANFNGEIRTSTDSGLTWTPNSATNQGWQSVASTSDGIKLAAVVNGGGIYTAFIPTNPPSITQQPQNLASCPGSSSLFTVAVTGTPPFAYQWRKEGTNLADGGHVAGSTTATLTLQSVSASDVASYDVVVTNLVGSVTSSPAILIVGPVPAKATPIIVNGFIIGATVTDGGCGYTNSPFIVFNGQGGSGAGGYGQVSGGSVTNIVVTNAGSGYPSSAIAQVAPPILPTVSITHTNTPAAKASPVIISGFIVGAIVTAPGSAYTTPPAVSFTDDTGVGAAAYTQISNGSVTNIVVTSAGSGYSSNTTITIPPAAYMNAVIPSAQSLMLGQNYQLETTDNLNLWMNYESSFFATNSSWSSPGYWLLRDDDSVFFRLRMLP